MNAKKLILRGILIALFAWTGVETYRYSVARNQLTASLEMQRTVQTKLAHLKSVQFASKTAPAVKP